MSDSESESLGSHDSPDSHSHSHVNSNSGSSQVLASPIRPDSLSALDHENTGQVEEGTRLEPDSLAVGNKRSRAYVFTANGPPATLDEYNERLKHTVLSLQSASGSVVYCICAKEVGESATYHLQGYCYFANARSFDGAKAFLSSAGVNCHIEVARGTPRQAADYCKKGSGTSEEPRDPDFWELGTIPVQGMEHTYAIGFPFNGSGSFYTSNFNDYLRRF